MGTKAMTRGQEAIAFIASVKHQACRLVVVVGFFFFFSLEITHFQEPGEKN